MSLSTFVFFFQAEDGIRDSSVTGVQTCALPISRHHVRLRGGEGRGGGDPESDVVAWRALVEKIGKRQARAIFSGGGYAVRSWLWPEHVLYVVTPEIIKVVNQGVHVSSICVVPLDGGSRWDAVLNPISLLEAGGGRRVAGVAPGAPPAPRV